MPKRVGALRLLAVRKISGLFRNTRQCSIAVYTLIPQHTLFRFQDSEKSFKKLTFPFFSLRCRLDATGRSQRAFLHCGFFSARSQYGEKPRLQGCRDRLKIAWHLFSGVQLNRERFQNLVDQEEYHRKMICATARGISHGRLQEQISAY